MSLFLVQRQVRVTVGRSPSIDRRDDEPLRCLEADSELSYLGVSLSLFEHVPDDRGDPPHDGYASDLGSAFSLQPLEPRSHRMVDSQDVFAGLAEHPPSHAGTGFGNLSDAFFLPGVAATGSQPEIVGQ